MDVLPVINSIGFPAIVTLFLLSQQKTFLETINSSIRLIEKRIESIEKRLYYIEKGEENYELSGGN